MKSFPTFASANKKSTQQDNKKVKDYGLRN